MRTLLAVPNLSEGRDRASIDAIGDALAAHGQLRILDLHTDPDHHRCVFSLAGTPPALVEGLLAGAEVACSRIRLPDPGAASGAAQRPGEHPYVGVLDVAPFVYLHESDRGAAAAAALLFADRLAEEQGIPVFIYGFLAQGRSRAELRAGGTEGLAKRIADGQLRPDFGAGRSLAGHGATLVGARPPLVAFNVQLQPPATIADARAIAARIREGGPEGLPGLRAIGVQLHSRSCSQVSMNVEDPFALPLRAIVAAIWGQAPVQSAELVGLAPEVAFAGFPDSVPLIGFDPERQLIERALQIACTH